MKSGSAAGDDRRSTIPARCRGTGARRSAKHSGRRDASDLDRLVDCFHAPLHRSRIRWFVLTSHADVLRDFQACSPCIHSDYARFSQQLAEVRTVFSWTQLSRTHTLMSYTETIFEDLRKPDGVKKTSTPLLARNRKKPRQHGTFRSPNSFQRCEQVSKTLTQWADSQFRYNRAEPQKCTGANKTAHKKL